MRNIIINERQEMLLMNTILNESSDEYVEELGPKRLELKTFLDKNFKKGSYDIIDDKGNPSKMELVVMMQGQKPLKSMDDKQLAYYIQSHDKFRNILPKNDRDKFIKDTLIAWYRGKISKNGNIMP